jgi:hypothetical protein
MRAEDARRGRLDRYARWYPLLEDEINLVALPDAGIIAVGKPVDDYLKQRGFRRPVTRIIHYSGQAGLARKAGIRDYEGAFETFRSSVSKEDLVTTAQDVLRSARVPADISAETLSRLDRFDLTASRLRLIFIYRLAFEAMRRQRA